uniref:Secreted protein n=1 Tax=Anopheles coluzzii TaxID=1518534 RepID=A0A8W7PGI1_ANOCL
MAPSAVLLSCCLLFFPLSSNVFRSRRKGIHGSRLRLRRSGRTHSNPIYRSFDEIFLSLTLMCNGGTRNSSPAGDEVCTAVPILFVLPVFPLFPAALATSGAGTETKLLPPLILPMALVTAEGTDVAAMNC